MGIEEAIMQELKEQAREEGLEEGIKKGEKQKTIRAIKKALERGKLTIAEIAEDLEVSVDFVIDVQKQNVN